MKSVHMIWRKLCFSTFLHLLLLQARVRLVLSFSNLPLAIRETLPVKPPSRDNCPFSLPLGKRNGFLASATGGDSDCGHDSDDKNSQSLHTRRTALSTFLLPASFFATATCAVLPPSALAAESSTNTATASNPTTSSFIQPSQAEITDKVFFSVRISRQDGTFYVRDDLPDTPENKVFYGRLTIGLFGKNAPRHVQNFLSYIQQELPGEDNPLPSYGRSQFPSMDQATGLLAAGKMPGLQRTEMNGSPALQYYGRLLPASLWLEKTNPVRIAHTSKGLLTHEKFDVTPAFGITTRKDTSILDATHTVFGQVLPDESSTEFLNIVQDLPTYGMTRATSSTSAPTLVDEAASRVFSAQRDFFRSTAKSFGDDRLNKVYEGKFLRRVEVTQVGIA